MNIRSLVIAVAVLVLSTTAGPAQDWMFPITDPKANPAPAIGPKANPVPAIDLKADPVPAIDPKADPAPAIDPKADPAPAIDPKADPAPAQGWLHNFYADIGASYLFQQDSTVGESSYNGMASTSLGDATLKFGSGFRGDLGIGYHINKLWSVEFNTGTLWNTSDFVTISGGNNYNVHGNNYTIPLLANVVYKIPFKNRLSAYIGAGAGGAAFICSETSSLFDPSDDTFVFAYQAEAGLKYSFTKNMSLDIGYKFLGTTDPTWKFTAPGSPPFIPSATYSFTEKGFYTHAIGINFTWTF
jgi:opacity protein-like surface antigen